MLSRRLLPVAAPFLAACLHLGVAENVGCQAGSEEHCNGREDEDDEAAALLAMRTLVKQQPLASKAPNAPSLPNVGKPTPAPTPTMTPSKGPEYFPEMNGKDQLKECLSYSMPEGTEVVYPRDKESRLPNAKKAQSWQMHNHRVEAEMKPVAVVFAKTVLDVEAASKCAMEAEYPISGQSGRHSYLAFCQEDCLLVNVALMKRVDVDKENETAILGAGLNLGQAYTYLDDYGFTIPGGTCPTVGLAGLTLGGGKGPLMRMAGLLVDSLIGVEAVLRNGTRVWATADNEPDLFWLARGGGGNIFPGIATAFHFKLMKSPKVMTQWQAAWPMRWGDSIDVGVDAMTVWQDSYVAHPDRRVYVRLELFPLGDSPQVKMTFKFIGMTREEAEPNILPAIRHLGQPINNNGTGEWSSMSYIKSIQTGGGIGEQSFNNTCKLWTQGLTDEEARGQMLMAVPVMCSYEAQKTDPTCSKVPRNDWTVPGPTFCGWDSSFDINMKYRGLVMSRLSDTAIRAFLTTLLQANAIYKYEEGGQFYLQIDPTNGASGETKVHETPYPWRKWEDMTMQVIAKWPGAKTKDPVLEQFNAMLVGELQPYVGSAGYYNYPDDEMPGGAIQLYSYWGANARRVIQAHRKYADLRFDSGFRAQLAPFRANQSLGLQPWLSRVNRKDAVADPLYNLYGSMMVEDMEKQNRA